MTNLNIVQKLKDHAQNKGDKIAFIDPVRQWTYREIHEESNRVANGLLNIGIGPRDRVSVLTKHHVECLIITLGAMKIGAVCMPVNWRLSSFELDFIFKNGESKFLMVDQNLFPIANQTEATKNMKVVTTDPGGTLESLDNWRAKYSIEDIDYIGQIDETCLQLYSSGTTGLPKGIELMHKNISYVTENSAQVVNSHPDRSRFFNILPIFHISGMAVDLANLYNGTLTVVYPDFDPIKLLLSIEKYKLTHLVLVPAIISAILNVPGIEKYNFNSLEKIIYGASPISEKLLKNAIEVFKCGFIQAYGLTETTGCIVVLSCEDHSCEGEKVHLLRSAGKAGKDVHLRVQRQ